MKIAGESELFAAAKELADKRGITLRAALEELKNQGHEAVVAFFGSEPKRKRGVK